MASPFAFPGTSISPPKSHLSGIAPSSHASHGHGHGHGHSHSHGHGHSHSNQSNHSSHSPSPSHSHNPSQTYAPSPLAHGRPMTNVGGSARLHRRTSHSSGVSLRGGEYEPSQQTVQEHHDHDHSHDHDHDHSHDHSHDSHSHDHDHHGHSHSHDHSHDHDHHHTRTCSYVAPEASSVAFDGSAGSAPGSSRFTRLALRWTVTQYPIVHAVLKEKDSRRIFYFMSLNFAFMTVQAFYGYVTDSLGLLSDSVHMFFDCVALAVGLLAAVASKWPPSERFPYGFGKIETLSGFANGIFLILISVEIMVEAFERLVGGRETQRLMELFVVSTLGLLVNLVGMFAFGHHGHDHGGHGHGHGHGHDHGHGHGHDHHDHDHDHHAHAHAHSHDNENMYGIYLHVLADTLGSAAVIASTVLTHFWAWSGWDPLASFLIALLIMLSAIPLVSASARRLLLTVPDSVEYSLRETLAGVPSLRGVASYAAPKFWMDDAAAGADRLRGVMHVVAARGADVDDVRGRVHAYLRDKGIDAVVQVERDGEGGDGGSACWCGPGSGSMGGGSGSVGGSLGASMANKRSSMVMAGAHGPKPSIL